MKSYSKPTADQVDAALARISSLQHEAYFFSRLENPHWIAPLAERDVFSYPPQAEHVEGGGVRFPRWPQSKYLARMAELAPEPVADLLSAVDTNNLSIIADILDAALVMPPDLARHLVAGISKAMEEGWVPGKSVQWF